MDRDPAFDPSSLVEDLESVRERIATRLANVGRTIAVMSGKGGVGKSAVAVNLSLALARQGQRVALLDADLNGPSLGKMLGLRGQPVRVVGSSLRPVIGPLEVAVQSMDFFLQGNQPLDWDGPDASGSPLRSAFEDAAIADLLGGTDWGERDILLIDLAPGAERLPALTRLLPSLLGALAVTIPTQVALLAVERSLRRAREAGIALIGMVENMGSSVCSACGHEAPLFREAPVEQLARDLDVPVVARIPFEADLAAAADAGEPYVPHGNQRSPAQGQFEALARAVVRWVPPDPEVDAW